MINGFALVSLISFILCLVLGIYVYFKKVRYVFHNRLSKLFVFLCLSLAFCWALIEFQYRYANNYEIAFFWLKLNVTWYFVLSFLLHFTLILTENYELLKRKLTLVIIYGPALVFFLLDITTNLLMTEPLLKSWGWTYGTPEYPLIYSISSTWAAFTGFFCIYICINYFIHNNHSNKRKEIKYALIGLLIPVTISLHTEWLFPIFNFQFPELIVPSLTIGLIIIWYSTFKYPDSKKSQRYKEIVKKLDSTYKKPIT